MISKKCQFLSIWEENLSKEKISWEKTVRLPFNFFGWTPALSVYQLLHGKQMKDMSTPSYLCQKCRLKNAAKLVVLKMMLLKELLVWLLKQILKLVLKQKLNYRHLNKVIKRLREN